MIVDSSYLFDLVTNDPDAFAKETELVERGEIQWLTHPDRRRGRSQRPCSNRFRRQTQLFRQNTVGKLFQDNPVWINRSHETCNASQASTERWLMDFIHDDDHHRSHQALANQPSAKEICIRFDTNRSDILQYLIVQ